MPAQKPTPEAMPTKELVLAAIERAERHRSQPSDPTLRGRRPRRRGVPRSVIKEHLGLSRGSGSTVRLRPTWNELQDTGLIEEAKELGMEVWRLTDAGQKYLDRARQAGDIGSLPESPQHREWREAQAIAREHASEFADRLRGVLAEATGLLGRDEPADSDTWQALSRRLEHACKQMASASYCLHEWQEPDDAEADIEPPRKRGLRSIHTLIDD